MAAQKGQPSTNPKGRPKGIPNKSTIAAREAIAKFVDGNAHRLQAWLDQVADGKQDKDGKYVVLPDPEKAFEMFQKVIEYHVPKLARTEVSGPNGGPMQNEVKTIVINGK